MSLTKVDTKAQPPRSIWVHPYKDEQFLKEHPEVREELRGLQEDLPPPYSPRRHSYSGTPTTNDEESSGRTTISQPSTPNTGTNGRKHRGFFGKLKDKAIGTKEEREAARKQEMLVSSPTRTLSRC